MPDLHSLPTGSRPEHAIRNNGPCDLALERYLLRELAEGWPCYRDACEWENLRSIFHPEAHIYTTWTGLTHHRSFIEASQAGMDKGAFIMHRIHGSTTDINPEGTRAVTKMKATITQRFNNLPCVSGGVCEADAESDCRFIFFWQKMAGPEYPELEGQWRAYFVRHWYEKDKLIAVTPDRVPVLDHQRLQNYPPGYRHLAYLQEETMGVKVLLDLPGHRREGGSVNGKKHDLLYWQAKEWVEGGELEM
ncbi:catabolic 3-dehydroquinase [Aspergillus sclerotioniger CBS 115572]|uniref:Catabolic 3-dehydroquinase n=1 Tax=Aspergillus sclerotioniger CBS 115572 TaxID=1450535 RepID=A0A317WM61_9EURO|nr:catabolic 3-dehydroquinase [Aspergillus sclerotioniger CBS 115572]PWY87135.1 catabolic 3-dehydroquinase [Aspergillus sclerotioniger CBS 115572]